MRKRLTCIVTLLTIGCGTEPNPLKVDGGRIDAGTAAPDAVLVSTCGVGLEDEISTEGPVIERINAPMEGRVVQRSNERGAVIIALSLDKPSECVEARLLGSEQEAVWTALEFQNHEDSNQVSGLLSNLPVGKHSLEIRAVQNGKPGPIVVLDSLWVGDVFIAAGQSNASFSGERPQMSTSGQVAYFNGSDWIACQDPVLEADPQGEGGAAWCLLGDLLFQSSAIPIAFVPLAWGGSSLHQWQEDSPTSPVVEGYLFQRLMDIVSYLGPEGVKAVLWHQGESELTEGTSIEEHRSMLLALIEGTRTDYMLPWFVSEVSYLADQETLAPYLCPGLSDAECAQTITDGQNRVIAGQRAVVDTSALIFTGVATDIFGAANRHDGSHFDEETLGAVASLWHARIAEVFGDIAP